MSKLNENENDFKSIRLEYLEKNKDIITDKEADIWDFMATANIKFMTCKNLPGDVICIKLNTVFFRSKLDY